MGKILINLNQLDFWLDSDSINCLFNLPYFLIDFLALSDSLIAGFISNIFVESHSEQFET